MQAVKDEQMSTNDCPCMNGIKHEHNGPYRIQSTAPDVQGARVAIGYAAVMQGPQIDHTEDEISRYCLWELQVILRALRFKLEAVIADTENGDFERGTLEGVIAHVETDIAHDKRFKMAKAYNWANSHDGNE